MERDLAYFEANPDQFADLSDADRMALMAGESIEGEIGGESPTAEDQQTARESAEESNGEPVVLAKDGRHTIPFEELQKAREQAQHWQARAEESARQLENQPKPAEAPAAVDLKDLRRQLREATLLEDDAAAAELEEAIDAEILRRAEDAAYRRLELRSAEAARAAEQRSAQEVADKLIVEHPYLDHQGKSPNWEAITQVQALRDLYIANGKPVVQALTEAVAKVAAMYAAPAGRPDSSDLVARKAAEAISKAKVTPPTSMSSIPSSDTPPTDELQAVAQLGRQALQDKLMDMPREKILELLNRQM